ncbi:MAG: MFS transporter [Candidatus Bathyarchaeia archaeon]|nr:MFS transporter [Candidatus Bathyarchaeota archaeon]
MRQTAPESIGILLLIMFSHNLYAADQFIIGTVLVNIMTDLSLSIFWSGVIATLFGLGMVFSSLLAGRIIEKIGLFYALLTGLFTFSLFTVLTGFSFSPIDISIYRIFVGIGEGLWNVSYYSVFGSLYPKRRGLASGIAGNMYIVGIFWSYPVASIIFSWMNSWRAPFHVFGLSGLFLLVLIMLAAKFAEFRHLEERENTVKQKERLPVMLKDRNIILGLIISFFAAITFYSITVFYPTYLRTVLNYDPVFSSTLTSTQMCSMMIMSPLILFLSDKYGRKLFLCSSSLMLAPVVYFMFRPEFGIPHIVSLLCIIYGAVNSGGYPLVVSFFQDLVEAPLIPLATSFCSAVFNIGSLASGPTTTYFVSLVGWEDLWVWLIICCLTYFLAAFMIKAGRP